MSVGHVALLLELVEFSKRAIFLYKSAVRARMLELVEFSKRAILGYPFS